MDWQLALVLIAIIGSLGYVLKNAVSIWRHADQGSGCSAGCGSCQKSLPQPVTSARRIQLPQV